MLSCPPWYQISCENVFKEDPNKSVADLKKKKKRGLILNCKLIQLFKRNYLFQDCEEEEIFYVHYLAVPLLLLYSFRSADYFSVAWELFGVIMYVET